MTVDARVGAVGFACAGTSLTAIHPSSKFASIWVTRARSRVPSASICWLLCCHPTFIPYAALLTVVGELKSTGKFVDLSVAADEDEHSIEMHLPYIWKVMQGYVCAVALHSTCARVSSIAFTSARV